MELEDFIQEYPTIDSVDDFQSMLYAKREFREKEGEQTEPDPRSIGEIFYRNQLLFIRIMSVYDVCLNISQAGTGKTCQAGGLAEYLKNNDDNIKQCYIITGNSLKSEFIRQMANYCTDGVYLTPSVKNAKDGAGASRAIQSAMKPFLTFLTYGEYTKMIEDSPEYGRNVEYVNGKWVVDHQQAIKANANIARDFSGCLFVFDELHFQRIEGSTHGYKSNKKTTNIPTETRRMRTYMAIWRVMHLMNRGKKLFFTATPVTNSGIEILYLLNIIYPLNQQLHSPLMEKILAVSGVDGIEWIESPDWVTPRDHNEMLLEYVEHFHKHLNGKIMFTAENQMSAEVSYVPVPQNLPPASPLIRRIDDWNMYARHIRASSGGQYNPLERIRPVPMVGIQRDTYLSVLRTYDDTNEDDPEADDEDDDEGPKQEVAYAALRAICSGVFPDGTYTGKDASEWLIYDGEIAYINPHKIYTRDGHTGNLKYWFANHLYQLSASVDYIVTGAVNYPGKRFVAVTLVKGMGADYVAMALESAHIYRNGRVDTNAVGFVRYLGTPYLDNEEQFIIKPALRYAIITNKVPTTVRDVIYELYRHPMNWNGDYIKVIIVSEVGQTGLSFPETMYVDFLDIPWSPGTEYQTRQRVIRVGAHNIHQSKFPKYRPVVEVNMLIPQLQNDNGSPILDDNGREISTVSMRIYLRMVARGKRNALIMRALKINAADCCLQRKRNALPPNMNNTPEADYMDANYSCYSCKDLPLDTSTYDVYYIDSMIDKIKSVVMIIFRLRSVITAPQIATMINKFNADGESIVKEIVKYGPIKHKYITATLWTMIHQSAVFVDQFGYSCYLRENNGNFFLTRTEPRSDPYANATTVYYNSNIIATYQRNFDDVVESKTASHSSVVIRRIHEAKPNDLASVFAYQTNKADPSEIIQIVETLTALYKSKIFEYIIIYTKDNSWVNIPNDIPGLTVKKYYNVNLFVANDPAENIAKVNNYISENRKGKIPLTLQPEKVSGQNILLHNLYYYLPRKTLSGSASQFKSAKYRIRVLKSLEDKWRDPTEAENWAYVILFASKARNDELKYINDFPRYYGIYENGEFKIRDLEHQAALSISDVRYGKTGKVCIYYNILELLYYTWQLGIALPEPHTSSDSMLSKRELIKNKADVSSLFNDVWTVSAGSTNSIPDEFVEYCYGYLHQKYVSNKSSYGKPALCIMILAEMIKTDRIYSTGGDTVDLYFKLLDDRNQKIYRQ